MIREEIVFSRRGFLTACDLCRHQPQHDIHSFQGAGRTGMYGGSKGRYESSGFHTSPAGTENATGHEAPIRTRLYIALKSGLKQHETGQQTVNRDLARGRAPNTADVHETRPSHGNMSIIRNRGEPRAGKALRWYEGTMTALPVRCLQDTG